MKSMKSIAALLIAIGLTTFPAQRTAAAVSCAGDDFNDNVKNTSLWGTDLRFTPGGDLVEANGRLEFRGTQTVVRPYVWSYRSYNRNWEVITDVSVGSVPLQPVSGVQMFLVVVNRDDMNLMSGFQGDNFSIALDLYRGTGVQIDRSFESYFRTDWTELLPRSQVFTTSQQASLRISFDATTKILTAWYDANGGTGGYVWTALRSVQVNSPGSNWQMASNSTFQVLVGTGCDQSLVTSSYLVYADNFNVCDDLAKASQTITFGSLGNKTYGDVPFALSATASSGLPASFSVVSGPATVNGNAVTITGAGTVTVRASQAGDNNYNPATSVDQSFNVAKATLTVTANDATRAYSAANPAFTSRFAGFVNGDSASAVSGAASLSTVATTASSPGTYPITPTVGTLISANYNFTFANGSLTITKADQTITFDPIPDKQLNDPTFTLTASASSGLSVAFSLVSGPATLNGKVLTLTGAGGVTVRASEGGDQNYNAAVVVDRTFQVKSANTAPVLQPIPDQAINVGATLVLTNRATDSDLPPQTLTFSLDNVPPTGMTLDSLTGILRWTPLASQAPSTNHIIVAVVDNGNPPLADTKEFLVVVTPATVPPEPCFSRITLQNGGVITLDWTNAVGGAKYQVQYKNALTDAAWIGLGEVTAGSPAASFTDPVGTGKARYYRVQVGP